jgi:putative ABC transport system permease protein
MSTWFRRIWHLINRRRFERDLAREMQAHRAMMHDPSAFGDTHRLIERSRDEWGWHWLDESIQDLSVGLRTLLKAPSFAVTAILIVSFGIGLNLTLFQMLQVALFTPPAIKSPGTFARFYRYEPHGSSSSIAYPISQFVKENNTVLSAVVVTAGSNVAWGSDASEQVEGSFVSANWFDELGYGPLHGRVLSDALDARAGVPSVVLGFRFWQSRLGGDPNVIGTKAYLDRKPVTIVGVAPKALPGLDFDAADVFIPISQREYFYPESALLREWQSDSVDMYGRLRPGVSKAAARDGLRPLMQTIAREHPQVTAGQWLEPLMATDGFMRPKERRDTMVIASLIAALTGLVLTVAAANLGNLVLSRATGRVRELGVRMALGARRRRIVRQLVVESIPIVTLGTAGSLVFAVTTSRSIASLVALPPYLHFRLDWPLLGAAATLAALTLLVVGVVPAWHVAQQHLIEAIKDGGQHVSRTLDRALIRRVMVGAQVAGSCLLLIVASMMTRSLQRVLRADLGFDYERAAVLSMPLGRYGMGAEAARAYWYAVKNRVLDSPEVQGAAIVTAAPLGGRVFETSYEDMPGVIALRQAVDPDYFSVMRIPLLSGRLFAPFEQGALVVSRRLALEMYGTLDVLGQPFPRSAGRQRNKASDVAALQPAKGTIVGMAADAHSIRITATNVTEIYEALKPADFSLVYLVARARSDANRLPPILREAGSLDPRVIPTAHTMREDFDRRTRGPMFASLISSAIGGLTLALACLGIFGVVSYGVALRAREIGIRVALGAPRTALLRVTIQQVLRPVIAGLVVGLASAIPTGIALSDEPFYLQHVDPIAFLAGLAVLAVAGTTAAVCPALATLRSNPIEALRHQ